MPRDIRAYFQVTSSKKVENEKTSKDVKTSNKKKRAIIESDSDEEVISIKEKKSPVEVVGGKRPKLENLKSKEPKKEINLVNISDVFGSVPVQQTARRKRSKSPDILEDPDALKAFQTEWDLTSFPEEKSISSGSGKPKSVKELDNQASTSSALKNDNHLSASINGSKASSGSSDEKIFPKTARCTSPLKLQPSSKMPKISPSKITSSNTLPSPPPKKQSSPSVTNSSNLASTSTFNHNVEISSKILPMEKKELPCVFVPSVSAPMSHLWVDKYKPSSLKQIIGQQGENSNVKKLLRWLSAWHSNHGPGVNKKLQRPSPWAKDDTGAYFKAALLSGPPGVGKTTTAHLVCKELGMDMVEFNASDTRSKKLMNLEVTELLSSKTLLPFFQNGKGSKTSDKHVLVMDEVDGMAGNEDRGGVQELISLIKHSKCPVVCMCNDRNHPKIRSLANYCYDLRFSKPRAEQIKGAMMSVCFKEKIQLSSDALNEVIVATNCDIRQVLHNLSMWSAADKKMDTEKTKHDAQSAKKHIKLGPWDTVKTIFSAEDHSRMSLNEKSDLFFNDYNIMPLFVQENYLIASPRVVKKPSQTLRQIAQASLSISYGDLVEKTIRSRNDAWSLLPVQAIYASVVPGEVMEGRIAGQIQFPSWLGKNSNHGKMSRLLQELQSHMRLSISGGKQAVNLDYIPSLQRAIVKPLELKGAEGVPDTLQVIQDYNLTLADLESVFELGQWSGQQHPMCKVESKVKAALTRTYNKSGIMTPYSIETRVSKKKGPSMEEEDNESESSSDSDSAEDAMIKVKKQTKASKTTASTSRGATQGPRGGRGSSAQGSGGHSRGRGRGRGKK